MVKASFLEEAAFAPGLSRGVFLLAGKDVFLSDGAGEVPGRQRARGTAWGSGLFVLTRFRACEVSEAGKKGP